MYWLFSEDLMVGGIAVLVPNRPWFVFEKMDWPMPPAAFARLVFDTD